MIRIPLSVRLRLSPKMEAELDRAIAVRNDDRVWRYLRNSLVSTRKNAARRGRDFKLSEEQVWNLYQSSEGRCSVTGVPFTIERRGSRCPFAPSLDRIDNALGYVWKNVRLTCQIANLAMNTWGEATLVEMIQVAHPHLRPEQVPER